MRTTNNTPGLTAKIWCGRRYQAYCCIATKCGLTPSRFTSYWVLFAFVVICTLFARSIASRDPGSWFFDPDVAYAPKYSAVRKWQAERFIASASHAAPRSSGTRTPQICVGIASVARSGARYLRTTVGSLLAGLDEPERDGIKLVVLIAHTDATTHPAYQEPWLSNLADEVLLYNLSQTERLYVDSLERDDVEHRTKGLYDYTYLLKACHAAGTPYIAMIEDDVIAMDGWYHRTIEGIKQAEARTFGNGFLYLRMFYTEEFLGWNSAYWTFYTFWSILTIATSAGLLCWARSSFAVIKGILTPRLLLFICAALIPWAIVLVFAVGRVTVFPLPEGVNEMNNFGCCAQGLVYPRHKATNLIDWYTSSRVGFADMLTEQYADEHEEQRWALTPSVLQHVGGKSSKPNDFGHGAKYSMSVAGTIWNFAFELNKVKELLEEHRLAAMNPAVL
ncbi:hypothetical protein M409DRAFT_56935 [Zasmidium cellare ATCC 36951]|uniref:Integral membrane protein n=1 Tax=Zasmidium cellare ATCC 36951 TaxID=1080233 RepID=A0A6A6CDJ4_ZASCE|nr:uncharacterized protein M409DRAFT_56935 [Zasmidium cellare ATCC 36951]KAF2164248.1 hypothetical protein M409DRAFT_56935 [Zasmidium cellare ATCC 36951]